VSFRHVAYATEALPTPKGGKQATLDLSSTFSLFTSPEKTILDALGAAIGFLNTSTLDQGVQ
jgi:hypothetical protein